MHVRPNTIARACFLIIEQVCSLAERLQEAYMYVAGFSSPSSEACDKTAPKPYDEALTYDIKRLPSRFRNITPSYSIVIKINRFHNSSGLRNSREVQKTMEKQNEFW